MATAKKAPKAAPAKKTAAAVDDLLAGKGKKADKGEDILEGKKGGKAKPAAKKAAPAKKAAAKKATTGTVEDIKTAMLKVKKLTSYQEIADAGNFDIRAVRRTARAMGDEGLIERVKEGTVVYVKKA